MPISLDKANVKPTLVFLRALFLLLFISLSFSHLFWKLFYMVLNFDVRTSSFEFSVSAGAFCVLFVAAGFAVLRKRQGVNWKLFTTLCTMFVLATVHLILDVIRAAEAFVDLKEGSALIYYLNLSNPLQAAKTAVYVTLTLVGDGFMIYRCYSVWGIWYMGLFPALLLLGTGAAGYGATYEFSQAAPGAEVFLPRIVPWVTSFIALTFSTNVVCTLLIAGRILTVHRRVTGITVNKINSSVKAVVVLTESAALYSLSVLSLLVTYTLDSNAQYTVLDLTSPLIGIVFSLIILRVTLATNTLDYTINSSSRGAPMRGHYTPRTTDNFGMDVLPVAVNVSQLVERDDGLDKAKHSPV